MAKGWITDRMIRPRVKYTTSADAGTGSLTISLRVEDAEENIMRTVNSSYTAKLEALVGNTFISTQDELLEFEDADVINFITGDFSNGQSTIVILNMTHLDEGADVDALVHICFSDSLLGCLSIVAEVPTLVE